MFGLDTLLSHTIFRPCLRLVLKLGFDFEVYGAENLPEETTAVILAGNHTGFLDGPVILAGFKQPVRFIVGTHVLSWPVIGRLIRYVGICPLNPRPHHKTLQATIHALTQGEHLCIFPEGKLSIDNEVASFQSGVGYLHRQSGAPIVPFAISGGFEAWPWGKRFPRRHKIILAFGKPIPWREDADYKAVTNDLEHQVRHLKSSLDSINCNARGSLSVFPFLFNREPVQ